MSELSECVVAGARGSESVQTGDRRRQHRASAVTFEERCECGIGELRQLDSGKICHGTCNR